MSQQPAVKMSAAPLTAEALEPAAGMLEGRQRKLESMIRDPRSPVNVESLLVRGAAGLGRAGPRGEALGGVTKGALPSPRAGGRGKEGRKGLPRPGGAFLGEDGGSFAGGGGAAPLRAPGRAAEGRRRGAGPRPPGAGFDGGVVGGLRREPRATALRLGTA